jgi:hypothetical protein
VAAHHHACMPAVIATLVARCARHRRGPIRASCRSGETRCMLMDRARMHATKRAVNVPSMVACACMHTHNARAAQLRRPSSAAGGSCARLHALLRRSSLRAWLLPALACPYTLDTRLTLGIHSAHNRYTVDQNLVALEFSSTPRAVPRWPEPQSLVDRSVLPVPTPTGPCEYCIRDSEHYTSEVPYMLVGVGHLLVYAPLFDGHRSLL